MLISSIIRETPDKAKVRARNRYVYIGNDAEDAANYHEELTGYLIVKKYGKE